MATEGDVVTFICKIMQSAEIAFYVDGKPMSYFFSRINYEVNCEELRIRSGVGNGYNNIVVTCKASNRYGFDVKNANLRVLGECIILFSVALFEFGED